MRVIVDAEDGEAFNLHEANERYLRRKKLVNRKGAWAGEQPPGGGPQPNAAAGESVNGKPITQLRARVKLFATLLQINRRVKKLQAKGMLS
ncbi:MAG: hypothetical protein LBD30_07955 [Verrucomicrobiales bacterium]|nr:hypothetical protein [Verrucomicrobiales bacterium]